MTTWLSSDKIINKVNQCWHDYLTLFLQQVAATRWISADMTTWLSSNKIINKVSQWWHDYLTLILQQEAATRVNQCWHDYLTLIRQDTTGWIRADMTIWLSSYKKKQQHGWISAGMTTWLSSYNKKQQPDESVLTWLSDSLPSHPRTRYNKYAVSSMLDVMH